MPEDVIRIKKQDETDRSLKAKQMEVMKAKMGIEVPDGKDEAHKDENSYFMEVDKPLTHKQFHTEKFEKAPTRNLSQDDYGKMFRAACLKELRRVYRKKNDLLGFMRYKKIEMDRLKFFAGSNTEGELNKPDLIMAIAEWLTVEELARNQIYYKNLKEKEDKAFEEHNKALYDSEESSIAAAGVLKRERMTTAKANISKPMKDSKTNDVNSRKRISSGDAESKVQVQADPGDEKVGPRVIRKAKRSKKEVDPQKEESQEANQHGTANPSRGSSQRKPA